MNKTLAHLVVVSVLTQALVVALSAEGGSGDARLHLEVDRESEEVTGTCVWEGQAGLCYFVQKTTDLNAMWDYRPVVFAGRNRTESVEVPCSGPQGFFRLRVIESAAVDPWTADFDGDRVSNGAELMADPQLDPLDAGSGDGDGVPDDWERYYFGSEGLYGDSDDPDGDAAVNAAEFENGGDPMLPDHPLVPLLVYNEPE